MQTITARFLQGVLGSIVLIVGMETVKPAIATAPEPPNLHPAVLNGKRVHVLYMTRTGDQVLVRCYPGQQPKVTVASKSDGTKEGTLVCGS